MNTINTKYSQIAQTKYEEKDVSRTASRKTGNRAKKKSSRNRFDRMIAADNE